MKRRYQFGLRAPGKGWSKVRRLAGVAVRLSPKVLRDGGEYRVGIRMTDKDIRWQPRDYYKGRTALRVAYRLARTSEVGETVIIQTGKGRQWRLRVCVVYTALPMPERWNVLVPEIKATWDTIARFAALHGLTWVSLGEYNCRATRHDASLWSEHSRWKDGVCAADWILLNRDGSIAGDKMDIIVRELESRFDNINCVWRSANHYDHTHLERIPTHKRGLVPVCAGGSA